MLWVLCIGSRVNHCDFVPTAGFTTPHTFARKGAEVLVVSKTRPQVAKCIRCGKIAPLNKNKNWYVCKCGCIFDPYMMGDIFSLTV